MNDRFLRALKRQPVDQTPVWIMRQAGRYLPEYRATRERAGDFLTLCKTPELACEVTLQPLARFDLDAAILFSDILTIPDAMGLGLSLEEGFGPRFAHPIRDHAAIKNLSVPDPETELRYVTDAVRLIKQELNQRVPLIGFAGSPWTLATYMVEGQSSRDFARMKTLLYAEPAAAAELLERLTDAVSIYLKAQIAAGVDAVMLFDTWGGALSDAAYQQYSLAPMKAIVQALKPAGVPIIVFTKGGGLWLELIADSGCDAVGVDWSVNLAAARQRIGQRCALQGNLDPAILLTNAAVVEQETRKVLDSFGAGSGHVFNLGHGITPAVNPDLVHCLVETVHRYSRQYHQDA